MTKDSGISTFALRGPPQDIRGLFEPVKEQIVGSKTCIRR